MKISSEAVESYHRDGFFSPVDAFSLAEAAELRTKLEDFEATLPAGPVARKDRRKLHVRLPWMRELVQDPRILDVIEQLIGPDILVYNSTFFIKEKNSDAVTYWHQDSAYFGLSPHEHVTAWVAFSNASELAGCMKFVTGSQARGPLTHVSMSGGNSLNNAAQGIDENFTGQPLASAPLQPGQFSLHHTNVIHASDPNLSNDRRIGCGISYVPTHVKKSGLLMTASLVRGADRYQHFENEPDPRIISPQEAVAAHEMTYARYRASYEEQIKMRASRDTTQRAPGAIEP